MHTSDSCIPGKEAMFYVDTHYKHQRPCGMYSATRYCTGAAPTALERPSALAAGGPGESAALRPEAASASRRPLGRQPPAAHIQPRLGGCGCCCPYPGGWLAPWFQCSQELACGAPLWGGPCGLFQCQDACGMWARKLPPDIIGWFSLAKDEERESPPLE
mmetsp:Transcript_11657/g.32921  ORF Transcript_11657/g.32921 Transcript_11657/m.32921 type:complete len:160 (+) Transcript_11657:54-533(+)